MPTTSDFTLREIHPGTPEYAQAAEVRYECLYVNWELSRDLIADTDGRTYRHLAAFDGDRIIGYGRIWLQDGHSKIFQVAVVEDWRRRGVGSALVAELALMAAAAGYDHVVLDSRDHAVPFYERLGFVAEGPEFLSARTNTPHVPMRRQFHS